MIDVTKLKIAGKINGKPVIYLHALQFYCDHGYVPDRISTTSDGTLYDMAFGPPITNALGVANCRLYEILTRYPDVTDRELDAIRKPLLPEVREHALSFFRDGARFRPMGDMAVTGGVVLRRFVLERLVQEGDLCYEDGWFKLT